MLMMSDGNVLTGLHFVDSCKVVGRFHDCGERDIPVFCETRRWLDEYFGGREPGFKPPYRIDELTPFRKDVIDAMLEIPFGETVTYGDIAAAIAKKRGMKRMSAQAVGGAVGWNPICIIIPCHRVIGANGALVGYGGGIKNKVALLAHERGGEECCQCGNIASTNTNSQFILDGLGDGELDTGNIGIGNTCIMATLNRIKKGSS